MKFFDFSKKELFEKKPFEWRSALLGFMAGLGVLFFALNRETPVVAAVVEGWLRPGFSSVEKTVVERATDRFEEVASIIDTHYHGEVSDADFIAMIDRGLKYFDRFDGISSVGMAERVASAARPRMHMGWRLSPADEGYRVEFILPGSPSDLAGLEVGDVLSTEAVEQARLFTLDEQEARIDLEVLRDRQVLDVSVGRGLIVMPSAYDYGVSDGVLHLVVAGFSPGVALEVRAIIDQHHGSIEGVMVDLRNNSGGRVDEAVAMLEDFLPEGIHAFEAVGRLTGIQPVVMKEAERWPGLEVVVLQNSRSASCSEIFAGALREAGRASIVGWPSVGKGSIQRSVKSLFGGDVRVTVAKYVVGDGVLVDGVGVLPSVRMPGERDESFPSTDDMTADVGRLIVKTMGDH